MKKRNVQKRPYIPIFFFLGTYLLIHLYHLQPLLFYITITLLTIITGTYLLKRTNQKKSTEYVSKEDFKQLLIFLFKKQGYSVSNVKKNAPIADLILRKKGIKAVVHIMTSQNMISADQMIRVKDNKHMIKAQKSIIVTNNFFSQEAKRFAKANKLTLMDSETIEAMVDSVKTTKRKHRFIVRVRSLLMRQEI